MAPPTAHPGLLLVSNMTAPLEPVMMGFTQVPKGVVMVKAGGAGRPLGATAAPRAALTGPLLGGEHAGSWTAMAAPG